MKGDTAAYARILVGDDLAREEKREPDMALRLASDLAEPLHAEIRLVHAYKIPRLSVPADAMSLIEKPYVDEMANALRGEVDAIRRRKPNLRIVSEIEKGDAVEVLLRQVARLGCRLVVMHTHGRHGVRRALIGSVAEEMIRRSPVPVISLNPHAPAFEAYRPSHLLVALDLTDKNEHVTGEAMRLAEIFGARVTLLSVIEEWVYPVVQSASLLAGGFVMPLERDLQELATTRDAELHRVMAPFESTGIKVSHRLIERAQSVGSAIVSEAQKNNVDLILMGHRHASRLKYALLGSVSRFVVRESHCPVMCIPPISIK